MPHREPGMCIRLYQMNPDAFQKVILVAFALIIGLLVG